MAQAAAITIRFWGVRGSIAAPGPQTVRYGGNTSCLEVRCGDHLLILDAGTGIRALGEALIAGADGAPLIGDVLLTHTHYDHVSGLPFFRPAYDPKNRFVLWEGHLGPGRTLEQVIDQLMSEPLFPVPVKLITTTCRFRKFSAGQMLQPRPGIGVRTVALNHPNGATGYRIEHGGRSFCYITDVELGDGPFPQDLLGLLDGADMAVVDSTFTDAEYPGHRGWGHSTWPQAVRLADAAGVGGLVLFHHEPARTDAELDRIAAEADRLRPGTLVAAEGMVLRL